MALEQFKSAADVDGKADVFSLGVILYQSLSGRLPHTGDTPYAVMGARLLDPITPIAQLVRGLPDEVSRLTMAMLAKEPGERPSMREVDQAVRRLRGLPPPRQSGFHAAARAGTSQPAPALPSGDDSLTPTADAPITVSPSMQLVPPTPSSDRLAGEISPPRMAVPQSLSSMPSLPLAAAPFRASPAEATAAAVPASLPSAALASPSAPTQKEPMSRRLRALILGTALISILLTGVIWRWPGSQPDTAGMGLVKSAPSQAVPAVAERPSAPGATASAPAVAPVPASEDRPQLAENREPERRTGNEGSASAHAKDGGSKGSDKLAGKGSAKTCEAQTPSLAWISSPRLPMSRAQRELILAALQDSGIKLCTGDRLQLLGLPHAPQIGASPTSVRKAAQNLLIPALRGALADSPFPVEVVVQCPPR